MDATQKLVFVHGSGSFYAFSYSIDGGANVTTPGDFGATGTDFIGSGCITGCTDENSK